MKQISILDIPFSVIDQRDIPDIIDQFLDSKKQHIIVTPNPEMVLESIKNETLKKILQSSSLSLPDGTGILWAAKFLSLPEKNKMTTLIQFFISYVSILFYPPYYKTVLKKRITGVDTMKQICGHSEQKKYSIFLLGGKEKVAIETKEKLEKMYQNISIVGAYSGKPFTDDDEVMIQKIKDSKAQIVFVAFGCPKQEVWIKTYLSKIPSVKIAMGIGGSFDFISGNIKRAPLFFQKTGLEWLWRLFQEPKKRFPRIYNAVVKFPLVVLKYKLSKK